MGHVMIPGESLIASLSSSQAIGAEKAILTLLLNHPTWIFMLFCTMEPMLPVSSALLRRCPLLKHAINDYDSTHFVRPIDVDLTPRSPWHKYVGLRSSTNHHHRAHGWNSSPLYHVNRSQVSLVSLVFVSSHALASKDRRAVSLQPLPTSQPGFPCTT